MWFVPSVVFISLIALWNLPPEEADFQGLEKVLKAKDWKSADEKTRAIVIVLATKKNFFQRTIGRIVPESKLYNLDDLARIDCKDIKLIDNLWGEYSQGKFGWGIQQKIWQSLPKPKTPYEVDALIEQYREFTQQVGWRDRRDYLIPPAKMIFDITAPIGHFPSWEWTAEEQNWKPLRYDHFKMRTMFSRIN
ncbi:GUN4 domain-containing protein [Pantanalinema sp. GBBB05]|uniref:GUN4 domain-containing protein n=1 Tax=Pantanalinema sp. GBBB05 TaxID=2604139 RepID=UPI003D81B3B5